MAELLTRTIALACPPAHAFAVFTDKIDLWWPPGHRRDPEASRAMTDRALVERSHDGTEWVMGRVTAMEPPHRIALDWFPGSPAAPTSVDIQFAATLAGTTITVTHSATTAAAAEIWPRRVATFIRGWDTVLPALKQQIEEA